MERSKHNTLDNILLYLKLYDPKDGSSLTGQSPTLSIRRYKDAHGALLDGYFWNGSAFQAGISNLAMTEIDATNNPGLYYYLFEQSLIQSEIEYIMDYTLASGPAAGFHDAEYHIVTTEAFIPTESSEGTPFDPDGILP